MNKKILPIFVMVMALSLLGVSCNKKTTDPTSNTSNNKPTFAVVLDDRGIASAPFEIVAKADASQTAVADNTAAGNVYVTTTYPTQLDVADITATPIAFTKTSGTPTIEYTASEFALDLTTKKLSIKGVDRTHTSDGGTAVAEGVVTFKLSANGYQDSILYVYVKLKDS